MTKSHYQRVNADGKNLKGFAALYAKGNKLYYRIPDHLGLGRNRYFATGITNNPEGRAIGTKTITVINNDILLEQFDPTMQKYLSRYKGEDYKAEVESITGINTSLQALWKMYCDSKKGKVKESTLHYLERTIGDKINSIPTENIYESKAVKDFLLETSTPDYTKRVITKVSSLFDWCSDRNILKGTNPYPEILKRLNEGKTSSKPPLPLSGLEVLEILDKISPIYKPLVQFLFLTGCRPSEGIGLTWECVKEDSIVLGKSITRKGGKVIYSDTSKNNKVRSFPMYPALKVFLEGLPVKESGLVFTNSKGESIDYTALYKDWVKVSSKSGSTPYNARDTFITNQIESGKPIAVVAQWVDNSIRIIESTYLKVGNKIKPE